MNKKRLLKLADYLDTVPRKAFDMSVWHKENCQTVGCAMGHACAIPEFRRAGLRLEKTYRDRHDTHYPCFLNHEGEAAAAAFFDLEMPDVDFLFYSQSYDDNPTPKQVAKRIRKFVEDAP